MRKTAEGQKPKSRGFVNILIVLLLCAVAITPLLRGQSPCTHDGDLHYFRVTAMKHAFQQGILFSRWLPDLAFGYGYPFFNYRAPVSYYLALGLHLTGLSLPWALNLVYVLSILGCGLGAFLLARDIFGPWAGLVAGVAYAYAPYQFVDALVRANAPESLALALMPFVLWAFRRLALNSSKGSGRRWFLASVGSLALLYLTHNISSLLFTPLLIAYLAALWWTHRQERDRWALVALALGLALGLTAFFWFPALAEKRYVQLHMSRVTRNNDFHYNFLGLREIFSPPTPLNTALMNPPMKIHLGLIPAVLAALQVFKWAGGQVASGKWASSRERWTISGFFALAAAVLIFMSTRASVWLWEHVPLLPFVQFPWRLIGRAALPTSLLAGALFSNQTQQTHSKSHASRFTFYFVVPALILAALPSLYPPHGYCPKSPHPTITDVFAYERQTGLVGVDPEGSYFPIWVKNRPESSPLEEQYATDGTIARFDESRLPEGAEVLEAEYGPNRARLILESPEPFRARYLTFYFPGWRVRVDGEPVEITPAEPDGLITFDLPAGRHEVTIRFGETPLRLVADTVSLLSLVLVVSIYLTHHSSSFIRHSSFVIRHSSFFIFHFSFAVLLLTFKLAIVDRMETPFRRSTPPAVEHTLERRYADGLWLIGYNQDAKQMPADGTLGLELYWNAYARPSRRYQSVIHLVGPNGLRWSKSDSFRPRGYADYQPTTAWELGGAHALDSHQVEPLPGAPPGVYEIVLTVFDRETLAPLSVLNEQGQPSAPELTLGQVALTAPRHPADPDHLGLRNRLDASLGPLTLLGADFDRAEAAPGDPAFITTFWRADERPSDDLTMQLELLAPDGSTAAAYEFPPAAPWHFTSAWRQGDIWRGQHLLHLPADLETAAYTWRLTLEPISQSTNLPNPIAVTAPDRTFNAPPVEIETNTRLGEIATLVGANVKPETLNLKPGTVFTTTLIWRAEAETNTSYRVFVHLIGPKGRMIAQSDAVPAGWSRPTTGWLPGEYITDSHTLALPPDAPAGEYRLQAGLYTPDGGRLTTPDGADAVHLADWFNLRD